MTTEERLAQWTRWLARDGSALRDELDSVVAACETLDEAAAVLRVPVEWLREATR